MLSFQLFVRAFRRGGLMNKHTGIGVVLLSICLLAFPAHADSAPAQPAASPSSPDTTMPQRERDLIAILADGQKQLTRNRSAKDTRLSIQIRVYNFLLENSDAKGWVGVVKDTGITAEGDRWISIEIAPGISVSTFRNHTSDPRNLTLIRPSSKLFHALGGINIDDLVTFNALIIGGLLAADTTMVETPEMMARFDAVERR
jgi:hypothetical protein